MGEKREKRKEKKEEKERERRKNNFSGENPEFIVRQDFL